MALIKCLECGKQVSDQAKVCPHCGMKLKIKKPEGDKSGRGVAIMATTFVLILMAFVMFWAFGRHMIGKNLAGAYNEHCKGKVSEENASCKLFDSGRSLKVATNSQNKGFLSEYETSLVMRNINKYMGFPSALSDQIDSTKESEGRITKEYNGYEITWRAYSGGYGFEVVYTKK